MINFLDSKVYETLFLIPIFVSFSIIVNCIWTLRG